MLCAGLGLRLRPLTLALPKPLLPVGGEPLLARTLRRLADDGCEAAALNLHHLGDRIRATFGNSFAGMPLFYSEEPEILGTLGGMVQLRDFFADADLALVVNGDTLCEWPVAELVARHRRARARATFLLAAAADPQQFGGGFGIAADGRVVAVAGAELPGAALPRRELVFAGAHVLEPPVLSGVAPGFADSIRDLYAPLLARGERFSTLITRRKWHDLGTPARYLEGLMDVFPRGWIAPDALVAPGARLRRSVVEAGAVVEDSADVSDCLLLPRAHVGTGSKVCRAIVSWDARVGPGAAIEGKLVNAGGDPAVELV